MLDRGLIHSVSEGDEMKAYRWQALLAMFALLLTTMPACGGGGDVSRLGAPAGSYVLAVTGTFSSGSTVLQHSIPLKLTVT